MMPARVRVLIATTDGPVEVESLIREDPAIGRSVVCIGGTTETAGIDREYHAFVSKRTGIVGKLFGHDCFRLDLANRIDAGASWQLPVFAAHALQAAGRLAGKNEPADAIFLGTGQVQPLDRSVAGVGHVATKLRLASERLAKELVAGRNLIVAWPQANAADADADARATLQRLGAEIVEANTIQDVLDKLGVTLPAAEPSTPVSSRSAPTPGLAANAPIFEGVPPSDRNFTGREEWLTELHEMLMGPERAGPGAHAAIHGLGGIGKTALAVEYAHRHLHRYVGVWWAPAEQRALLIGSLAMLASRLDPQFADEPDQEKAAKAALKSVARSARPYLLIYDNVENPDTVRDLIPSAGARVLMTTRWPDWGGKAAEVKLDVLPEITAAQFLQKRAGRNDADSAARLAAALGHLPLALDHAGAYCRLTATSFDAYLKKIDTRIAEAPKGAAYPASITATFGLAIERAAAAAPSAEALLGVFAFLAPEPVPLDIITDEVMGEDERAAALMELSAVSLIDVVEDEGSGPAVALHRLVQAAMRTTSVQNGRADVARTAATVALAAAFPSHAADEPKTWPRCALLLPHVMALRENGIGDRSLADAADLLSVAGSYLFARAAYQEAEPFYRDALAITRKLTGTNDPKTATRLNNLGYLLGVTGRYEEAETLIREAIDIAASTFGPQSAEMATMLNTLALLLRDTGRREEAEKTLRDAIRIDEETIGHEHANSASRLQNLGVLLQDTGREDEAEPLLRKALVMTEGARGKEHIAVARRLYNLARLLNDINREGEAEVKLNKAIDIFSRTLGESHPNTAAARGALADVLLKRTDFMSAQMNAKSALTVYENVFGASNKRTLNLARIYATALEGMGRAEQAGEIRARYGVAANDRIEGLLHTMVITVP